MSTPKSRKKLEPLTIDGSSSGGYLKSTNTTNQTDLELSLKGSLDGNLSFQSKPDLASPYYPPTIETCSESPSTSSFQQEIEIMKKKLAQMSDEELFTNVHKLYQIVVKHKLDTYDEE